MPTTHPSFSVDGRPISHTTVGGHTVDRGTLPDKIGGIQSSCEISLKGPGTRPTCVSHRPVATGGARGGGAQPPLEKFEPPLGCLP